MASEVLDACVVGAGWCGLYAVKYLLEYGQTVVCYDKNNYVGGLWKWTSNTEQPTVASFTVTSTPKAFTEASDFPWPEEEGMYIKHNKVYEWLESYTDHFNLRPHLRLGHAVVKLVKSDGLWKITARNCETNETVTTVARNLLMCTGLNNKSNDISGMDIFKGFTGKFVHSTAIKNEIEPELTNKVVVAYGGGENASDIAYHISKDTKEYYLCVPHGQWMQPRCFATRYATVHDLYPLQLVEPNDDALPWEYQKTPFRNVVRPMWAFSGWNRMWLESCNGIGGHGVDAWKPTSPVYRAFGNKADLIHHALRAKRVIPKRRITHCEGKRVFFCDGTSVEADVILMCTGLAPSFPIMPEGYEFCGNARKLYKQTFFVNDPSLAFVGISRPVQGSIPQLAEVVCVWISKVIAGKVKLPDAKTRRKVQQQDEQDWERYFRFTSNRIKGLVDGWLYSTEIAEMADLPFSMTHIWRKWGFKVWWYTLWAPTTMHMYLAQHPDPKRQQLFLDHVKKFSAHETAPMLLVLNIPFAMYDLFHYPVERFKWAFRERFVPFYRNAVSDELRGKESRFEQFWIGRFHEILLILGLVLIFFGRGDLALEGLLSGIVLMTATGLTAKGMFTLSCYNRTAIARKLHMDRPRKKKQHLMVISVLLSLFGFFVTLISSCIYIMYKSL